MPTTPPPITPVPTPVPQRGDRTTFSSRVDAFIVWLINAVTQFGAVATNVYNNALETFGFAQTAQAQATAAQALVNVAKWVSGTTYQNGAAVWSPANGQTYRRITAAGSGTTDPSLDTVNYAPVVGMTIQSVAAPATYTVQLSDKGRNLRFSADATVTFPASATLGNGWYCFIQNNGSGSTKIAMNPAAGETFQGYSTYGVNKDGAVLVTSTGSQLTVFPFTPRSFGRFGSAIAASATLNLDGNEGDVAYITGAADITAVTLAAGVKKTAIFTGASRLVHSSNLVTATGLPMALDPGSVVEFIGIPGGTAQVVSTGRTNTGTFQVQDQKVTGTAATALATGTDNVRPLNTIVGGIGITGAALSGNQVTLPPGTYDFTATASCYKNSTGRLSIFNVTDGTRAALGLNITTPTSTGENTGATMTVQGRVTIAAQKVFELRHYLGGSGGGSPGLALNQAGVNEVYADLFIEKVS